MGYVSKQVDVLTIFLAYPLETIVFFMQKCHLHWGSFQWYAINAKPGCDGSASNTISLYSNVIFVWEKQNNMLKFRLLKYKEFCIFLFHMTTNSPFKYHFLRTKLSVDSLQYENLTFIVLCIIWMVFLLTFVSLILSE